MWQEEQKASHLPCFLTNKTTKSHNHTQHNKAPVFSEQEAPFNFFVSSVSSPGPLVRDMRLHTMASGEELPQLVAHASFAWWEKILRRISGDMRNPHKHMLL